MAVGGGADEVRDISLSSYTRWASGCIWQASMTTNTANQRRMWWWPHPAQTTIDGSPMHDVYYVCRDLTCPAGYEPPPSPPPLPPSPPPSSPPEGQGQGQGRLPMANPGAACTAAIAGCKTMPYPNQVDLACETVAWGYGDTLRNDAQACYVRCFATYPDLVDMPQRVDCLRICQCAAGCNVNWSGGCLYNPGTPCSCDANGENCPHAVVPACAGGDAVLGYAPRPPPPPPDR